MQLTVFNLRNWFKMFLKYFRFIFIICILRIHFKRTIQISSHNNINKLIFILNHTNKILKLMTQFIRILFTRFKYFTNINRLLTTYFIQINKPKLIHRLSLNNHLLILGQKQKHFILIQFLLTIKTITRNTRYNLQLTLIQGHRLKLSFLLIPKIKTIQFLINPTRFPHLLLKQLIRSLPIHPHLILKTHQITLIITSLILLLITSLHKLPITILRIQITCQLSLHSLLLVTKHQIHPFTHILSLHLQRSSHPKCHPLTTPSRPFRKFHHHRRMLLLSHPKVQHINILKYIRIAINLRW
jgi:hypothetical protein